MKGKDPVSFCTNKPVVKVWEGEKLLSLLLLIVLLLFLHPITTTCPMFKLLSEVPTLLLDILVRAGQALQLD